MTIPEFYRRLASSIGQLVSVRKMRQDNTEVVVQNFNNQQSELSGVDINDEAARMLLFEQMFRAMAKYLNTVQSSLEAVMEIL
jgi:flagellar hook-associated protein FlgK